jgi:hypothetical protein
MRRRSIWAAAVQSKTMSGFTRFRHGLALLAALCIFGTG